MKTKINVLFMAVLMLAIPSISSAVEVYLTAGDGFGASSFNTVGQWDDSSAPTAGNDYFNAGWLLRTPADGNSYTFEGDSLTITGEAGDATALNRALMWKGSGTTSVITINDLILDGGYLRHGQGDADSFTLDGQITVTANGAKWATQGGMLINSAISGSGTVHILDNGNGAAARTISIGSSANTFNGDISLEATGNDSNRARLALATNASLNFVIGNSGINNSISGTGTVVFAGDFVFDLSGAETTVGASWDIASVSSQTFSSNFTVVGFLDNGDGSWFKDNGTGKYKFYEDTGVLESVSANVFPIAVMDITPADGKEVFVSQPGISITLVDGNFDAVVTSSILMTVDSINVTPSVTSPGSGTTVVSYTPASPLAAGPVSVQVTFDDNNSNSYTNSWTFNIHATTTEKLWNINIAGLSGGVQRPVTDGVIAVAPSAGANLWNNVAGINGVLNTFYVTDANGANQITYETSGVHNWGESTGNGMTVEMFQGWTGTGGMNMTNELTGLDPDNAYDIYLYSTWRWTQNAVNYEIIEGFADVTAGSCGTASWANVQNDATNDYSGCVEGRNYIILHSVTPTASGRIAFTGKSSDGPLSGFQILEITGAGSRPDIAVSGSDPADGAVIVNATPTLEAYFTDVDGTVNSGSISMTIDGASVSPSFSYSDPVSTISYTVSTPLVPSSTAHTVEVVVASSPSGTLFTNSWTFAYKKAPAISAVKLWNVNFAGLAGGTVRPVSDGSVVKAPSSGSDLWYNVAASNQTAAGSNTSVTNTFAGITDASGGNAIQLETRGSQRWGESIDNNITVELFQGWAGANANCNYDSELSGLDAGATYDLYVYSTWRWNENDTVYSLVEGTAGFTNAVVAHNQANIQGDGPTDYSGLVEGQNYFVFTAIKPTIDGRIVFHVGNGTDTVCNGFQLVQRPEGGPAFAPEINSIAVAGGNVTIYWDSDTTGVYQIESKSSLTVPTWSPVSGATGLSGGAGQSTVFPVSGDPAEFFRVSGE